MFIVSLTYQCELNRVTQYLDAHRAFLDRYYAEGLFLASGPQVPRIGGIILANVADRHRLEQILTEDPFQQHRLARYDIVEFTPTKTAPALVAYRLP